MLSTLGTSPRSAIITNLANAVAVSVLMGWLVDPSKGLGFEVLGELLGRGVAPRRFLAQRGQYDRVEIAA